MTEPPGYRPYREALATPEDRRGAASSPATPRPNDEGKSGVYWKQPPGGHCVIGNEMVTVCPAGMETGVNCGDDPESVP